MADTVRYFLEKMVPELEELEEKGYFTKHEIKEIVRRRENFEYSLKRRTPAKADFIRCLEFEQKLLDVMELRKTAKNIKETKSPANAVCIRRCHETFERACRKFKGDLSLWMGWLQFCKATQSNRRMSKVLTSALQIHPSASGLWSYAAAWEFEGNKNPSAARILMQEGLRACKNDPLLWLEYFKMELVHAHKLVTRRKILGISSTEEENNSERLQNEASEPSQKAYQAVLSGAIAGIVAKEALNQIKSVDLCEQMLKALEAHPFPGTNKIAAAILKTMRETMGDKEEAWDLQARQRSHSEASTSSARSPDNHNSEAERVYSAAVQKLPTTRMFNLYLKFLEEQVSDSASKASLRLKGKRKKAAQRMVEVFEQAASNGALSAESALLWPQILLRLGDTVGAVLAAEEGTRIHPSSEALWLQHLQLSAQLVLAAEGEEKQKATEEVISIVRRASRALDSQNVEFWAQAADSAQETGVLLSHIFEPFCELLATRPKGPLEGGLGEVAGRMVKILWQKDNLEAARNFYRKILSLPSPGGAFYHAILDLELDVEEDTLPANAIRSIFEAAVVAHGKEDVVMWVRYARYLQKLGKGYGTIAWRASKELNFPDEFIALMSSNSGRNSTADNY